MSDSDLVTVPVDLGERSYDVVIGPGARHRTVALLPGGTRRVAVVTQEGIPARLRPDLGSVESSVHLVGGGEEHKTMETVARLCGEFSRSGLTRGDVVVSVGGGMTSDVAGFAAATYHRGVAIVHVSTTLLGMVDAAIGGKTGVNLPEGKNLVGAYWQPSGVVCDLDALESLPERERRCGLGEMAKYHFIDRVDFSGASLRDRIARCVEIKSGIVSADEREDGRRALLNYGHTLAHALETETGYSLAHGEAVAVGLVFAAELAAALGRIDSARVEEHRRIVGEVYGLSAEPPAGLVAERLLQSMSRDKKSLGTPTFVLDSPGGLEVVRDVPADVVLETLRSFLAG